MEAVQQERLANAAVSKAFLLGGETGLVQRATRRINLARDGAESHKLEGCARRHMPAPWPESE